MQFLKKYWYLVVVFIITAALGIATFLISQKLKQEAPVAPTVPQEQPKAVTQACTLAFTLTISTPTPTPTPTSSETPTSTPTPTPTPTPTSAANTSPECTGLSASPNSATSAPLTVNFTCSGVDPDGDITAAEFSFGDGQTQLVEKNVGSPGAISISYNYAQNGNFSASCRIRDNNFKFSTIPDSCKKNITIGSGQTTTTTTVVTNLTPTPTSSQLAQASPTAAPTPKVPVSGAPSVLGAFIILGGILVLTLGLAL